MYNTILLWVFAVLMAADGFITIYAIMHGLNDINPIVENSLPINFIIMKILSILTFYYAMKLNPGSYTIATVLFLLILLYTAGTLYNYHILTLIREAV